MNEDLALAIELVTAFTVTDRKVAADTFERVLAEDPSRLPHIARRLIDVAGMAVIAGAVEANRPRDEQMAKVAEIVRDYEDGRDS